MMAQRRAFTLIEILVATALFVSLMALSAVSFQRISQGSDKALQVLDLHSKADILLRYLESDLRNMPQTTALHLQSQAEPYTLTFMRPVDDTNPNYFHLGDTENSTNYFEDEPPRLTDLIWVRWKWESGSLSRGQSRINYSQGDIGTGSNAQYNVVIKRNLHVMDLESRLTTGIQRNAISPTPQQHYDFFEGVGGSLHTIAADGSLDAGPAEKAAVYRVVSSSDFTGSGWNISCTLVETSDAPWRSGDYRHLYTTLEIGNSNKIPDAYAVRNLDGKSLNKDRLNLLGCKETDGNGNYIYPNQVRFLFSGVEYLNIELIGRDGRVIDSSVETDRLNDGSDSIDISGVDMASGYGYDKRPTHVRLSYLLHAVDLKERDDLDIDGDGIDTESLAEAIRDVVASEGWATRLERMHSYKQHALRHGFASVLITQSVQLGY